MSFWIVTVFVFASATILLYFLSKKSRWFQKRKVRKLISQNRGVEAINWLEGQDDLESAVAVARHIGHFERAGNLCLQNRQPIRAAKYFEKAGNKRRAALLFAEEGHLKKSAQLYSEIQALQELAQFLISKGKREIAVKVLLIEKAYEKAAALLTQMGKSLEASITLYYAFVQMRNQPDQSDAFHRIGKACSQSLLATSQWKRAAKVLMEIKHYFEAAECFARHKDYVSAAEICRRIGELSKAEEYLMLGGRPKEALRMRGEKLAQQGEVYQALDCFLKGEDFIRAGDMYCDLQQTKNAAEMYEKGGEIALAATFYQHTGEHQKAGQLFERIPDYENALASYRKGECYEDELRIKISLEDFLGVARIHERKKEWSLALKALERIPEDSPHYREALALKGNILIETGNIKEGIPALESSISMASSLGRFDLETIFRLKENSRPDSPYAEPQEFLKEKLSEGKIMDELLPQAQELVAKLKDPTRKDLQAQKEIRYIPMKELGRGGMGIVYTALDTALDRTIALKILPVSLQKNTRAVHTFLREARLSASLSHPNIVTVFDTGTQNGMYFIAMELIEGETLKSFIYKRARIPYRQVFAIFKQILHGIQHAHSKNLIHRDLTSNNIMVTQNHEIKIMDFGLAKISKDIFPEQSILGGTPSYMSPEQTKGTSVDQRSDIYSMGVTLFEMALRNLPFSEGDLAYHHVHTPPPNPLQLDPNMPEILSQIILKCMEKDPANRYQSAQEILEALN